MKSELRESAPLLDAYLSYFESKRTPFTIPGHKQKANRLDAGLGAVVDRDAPLYGGLDEIKLTNRTLEKAEALAASLWGADFARFSTGGSTHANQAIILALAKPEGKVAVTRTAHRSILSALVLAGLEPLWLTPVIDSKTGFPTGIPISELERVLSQKPIALLLTEPGYLGTMSELPVLIAKAHENSIPVIIDAAWGAHFGFHDKFPEHALQLGADALVTSVHKNLPGYSGAALLLAQGNLLNLSRLEQSFETTHTTSPGGAPLASIDACRALLQTRGHELVGELLANVTEFRAAVQSNFDVPVFLNAENFPAGRFDPVKLVLRTDVLGISGLVVEAELQKVNIRVEMADHDTVVFLATLADDRGDFKVLEKALVPILKTLQGPSRQIQTSLSWSVVPTIGLSTRDAYFADSELVTANAAIGRISADLIAPYPPGVAVLAPGEVITEEIVSGLSDLNSAGVRIAYASDPTLENYRVVKEK